MRGQALRALLPVVVLLAVDAAVLAEAGELRLQVEFALAALEAAHVPLLVHGQQVVAVHDLPAAAGAQSDALAGQTGQRLRVRAERLHTHTRAHARVDTYTHTHMHTPGHTRHCTLKNICV